MARLWCIWSPKGGKTNLEFGFATSTWGLPRRPNSGTLQPGDLVLFGSDVAGGPRIPEDQWLDSTGSVGLAEVTTAIYDGTAPHWPDEVSSGEVRYPVRFGITSLGSQEGVSLNPTSGPLDPATTLALRNCGVSGYATLVADADVTQLLSLVGASSKSGRYRSTTTEIDAFISNVEGRGEAGVGFDAQGRTSDPKLRRAIEAHAVKLAIEHLKSAHGWRHVTELGKPYDLICRRDGEEKHVEVKGTTGAGGAVIYTRNEVAHFRSCPHGADLIVVREIKVDRATDPYTASGGTLRHIENYDAPGDDLEPLTYEGRVSW